MAYVYQSRAEQQADFLLQGHWSGVKIWTSPREIVEGMTSMSIFGQMEFSSKISFFVSCPGSCHICHVVRR